MVGDGEGMQSRENVQWDGAGLQSMPVTFVGGAR